MAIFEIQGPDGAIYEVDAPDEQTAVAAFQTFSASMPAEQAPADGQGFWNNVAQSAGNGLFMGLGDEISAGLNSLTGYDANTGSYGNWGTTYDDQLSAVRGQEKQFGKDHPFISTGAEIGGALVPALAGLGVVSGGAGLRQQMLRGGVVGGAMGGITGFNEGEGGFANRLGNVPLSATGGGLIGAAAPGVANVAGHLYRAGEGALRSSRIGQQIGEQLGISPKAGQVVGNMLGIEDQKAMQAALNRAGPDAMLADASPSFSMNLRAAMQTPNPGSGLARNRVDDRAAKANYDILDALVGKQQGPRIPPGTLQNRMAESARGEVNPAYQRAYGTEIDYSSPAGQDIIDFLARVPPAKTSAAMKSANERMTYDGFPMPPLTTGVGENGALTMSRMPNVMELDYTKRAFDAIAEDSKDALTGRMTSDGAFASRIAGDVRERLKEAVPAYGEALEVAANDIRQRGAVRTGQRILDPGTTVEDAMQEIGNATGAELRAMREGLLGQFEHVLGNVRAVASDQNVDARQAVQALRDLSSPNAQRKMQSLFGDEWPAIKEAIDHSSAAIGLRASTAARSDTAANLLFNDMVQTAVEPGALRSLQPLGSARQVGQTILGSTTAATSRARDEVKGEIADLLTRQGGAPQKAVSAIVDALMKNPANPKAGKGVSQGALAALLAASPQVGSGLRSILGR